MGALSHISEHRDGPMLIFRSGGLAELIRMLYCPVEVIEVQQFSSQLSPSSVGGSLRGDNFAQFADPRRASQSTGPCSRCGAGLISIAAQN